ncbi:hypothetical protein Bbelb_424630 [Branchiostoma belcheri]|nr:hypothetical protein Bbelb_424630 [Branchiostoma belcheri]
MATLHFPEARVHLPRDPCFVTMALKPVRRRLGYTREDGHIETAPSVLIRRMCHPLVKSDLTTPASLLIPTPLIRGYYGINHGRHAGVLEPGAGQPHRPHHRQTRPVGPYISLYTGVISNLGVCAFSSAISSCDCRLIVPDESGEVMPPARARRRNISCRSFSIIGRDDGRGIRMQVARTCNISTPVKHITGESKWKLYSQLPRDASFPGSAESPGTTGYGFESLFPGDVIETRTRQSSCPRESDFPLAIIRCDNFRLLSPFR